MCSGEDFQQETVSGVTLEIDLAPRLRDSFQMRSVLSGGPRTFFR